MSRKKLFLLIFPTILAACSSSDSTTPPTNPITSLAAETKTYMATAIPSGASSSNYVDLRATTDWVADNRVYQLANPSEQVSIAGYFDSLFDQDYEVEGFGPTIFGRFGQELEVLEIIAAQVPFTNGAPTVGTHNVTTAVGDSQEQVTFEVVVTDAAADNFDVVLTIATPFAWKAAMRNQNNQVNIISSEIDGTDGSVSMLFWNKTTGKLRYDFFAKQADGTLLEVHRLFIEETGGASYAAHIYETSGMLNYAAASTASGSTSAEFSTSFEFVDISTTLANFAVETYCVSTSTGLVTDVAACASSALPGGDASNLANLRTDINMAANGAAMVEAMLGVDYAGITTAVPNYDTGSLAGFLTAHP